jgi:hypothetical protein
MLPVCRNSWFTESHECSRRTISTIQRSSGNPVPWIQECNQRSLRLASEVRLRSQATCKTKRKKLSQPLIHSSYRTCRRMVSSKVSRMKTGTSRSVRFTTLEKTPGTEEAGWTHTRSEGRDTGKNYFRERNPGRPARNYPLYRLTYLSTNNLLIFSKTSVHLLLQIRKYSLRNAKYKQIKSKRFKGLSRFSIPDPSVGSVVGFSQFFCKTQTEALCLINLSACNRPVGLKLFCPWVTSSVINT